MGWGGWNLDVGCAAITEHELGLLSVGPRMNQLLMRLTMSWGWTGSNCPNCKIYLFVSIAKFISRLFQANERTLNRFINIFQYNLSFDRTNYCVSSFKQFLVLDYIFDLLTPCNFKCVATRCFQGQHVINATRRAKIERPKSSIQNPKSKRRGWRMLSHIQKKRRGA